MNSVKIAGVFLSIRSLPADKIKISVKVYYDPQILTSDGTRIDGGGKPVEDAINAYLAGIVYGGTFNKTKCVDAIQNVQGVIDVELGTVQTKTSTGESYAVVTGNNYTAESGCFISEELSNTITYVVQN